jgi:DNA mismatch endonuclease, patch repair protein
MYADERHRSQTVNIWCVPDRMSPEKRSKVMSRIRSKNTKPETTIRKLLWAKGKRYRIHDKSIFGKPDLTNKSRKTAVFIDGCFWHGCVECYREPKSNVSFWREKLNSNKKRRIRVKESLLSEGWIVLEFWEHEVMRSLKNVISQICLFL